MEHYIYSTHHKLVGYELGVSDELERMLSIWDARHHAREVIAYLYDPVNKVLRFTSGVSTDTIQQCITDATGEEFSVVPTIEEPPRGRLVQGVYNTSQEYWTEEQKKIDARYMYGKMASSNRRVTNHGEYKFIIHSGGMKTHQYIQVMVTQALATRTTGMLFYMESSMRELLLQNLHAANVPDEKIFLVDDSTKLRNLLEQPEEYLDYEFYLFSVPLIRLLDDPLMLLSLNKLNCGFKLMPLIDGWIRAMFWLDCTLHVRHNFYSMISTAWNDNRLYPTAHTFSQDATHAYVNIKAEVDETYLDMHCGEYPGSPDPAAKKKGIKQYMTMHKYLTHVIQTHKEGAEIFLKYFDQLQCKPKKIVFIAGNQDNYPYILQDYVTDDVLPTVVPQFVNAQVHTADEENTNVICTNMNYFMSHTEDFWDVDMIVCLEIPMSYHMYTKFKHRLTYIEAENTLQVIYIRNVDQRDVQKVEVANLYSHIKKYKMEGDELICLRE